MSIFNKRSNKVQQFNRVTKDATNEEKRLAEEALLKPENVEPYAGELPVFSNELESRTVLIVFRDKAQMDLVGNLFSIRHSCTGKSYITCIDLLEHLAVEVQEGRMEVKDNKIVPVELVGNE